ncbi:tetratricopeptide repeat protein [Xylophilus sp. Kf1]|nr:tetratricopeptide repeat protein [Xylophilus sp. Kf1]
MAGRALSIHPIRRTRAGLDKAMQSHTRTLIAAAAVSLLMSAHGVVLAQAAATALPRQSPAVIATLSQQGRYWQTRQPERAAEAWNKLLAADPGNAEALSQLGSLAVVAKKPADARRYLDQLRRAHPDSPEVGRLEQEIEIGAPAGQADLDQARILVREKRFDEAVAKYKALFKGREPQGPIGLEYYSVLGYTTAGREEAQAGLRRLQKDAPADPQLQLTIASQRLQNPATRLDAMRTLAALSRRQDVGGEASDQWRGAMGWLGSPPPAAYAPLFRQYLAANPGDTELREQLAGRGRKLPGQGVAPSRSARDTRGNNGAPVAAAPKRLAPEALHTADGYAEIQNKDYDKADAEFSAALKINPRFADAAGGMALLRFRQQRFADARRWAQEAYRLDGQDGWKILLDTVGYWDLLSKAADARDARRFGEAERLLRQAMAIKLEEPDTNAENRLAGVYVEQKRYTEAESLYRGIIARVPDDQLAMSGLVGLLASTDRAGEARTLIDTLTDDQRAGLDLKRLNAEVAVGTGRAALKRGQEAAAREQFQQAVDLQPDNPWMRLELARAELRGGDRAGARDRMESLLARKPADPDVVYTTALFRGNLKDWAGVVELLERVPPGQRTPAMATLQRSAAIHVQTDQALALAHDGRRADADALLAQAAQRVGNDADLLGILAQGYIDLGDLPRARELLRGAIERTARNPADSAATTSLQLRYGSVLLAAEDDRNLADVLRQLQVRARAGQLDADDLENLQVLRSGYVMRQAEALRKQGRLAEAYELLRPLLAATPEDPVLLGLLARMYNDDGQKERANALYRDILARDPDDVGSLTAAAGVATQQRDYRTADAYIDRAEKLAPQNPDVLATRGRLFRAQGRPSQAVIYLNRAAEQLRAREPMLSGLPDVAAPTAAQSPAANSVSQDNPFSGGTRSLRSAPLPQSTGSATPSAPLAR